MSRKFKVNIVSDYEDKYRVIPYMEYHNGYLMYFAIQNIHNYKYDELYEMYINNEMHKLPNYDNKRLICIYHEKEKYEPVNLGIDNVSNYDVVGDTFVIQDYMYMYLYFKCKQNYLMIIRFDTINKKFLFVKLDITLDNIKRKLINNRFIILNNKYVIDLINMTYKNDIILVSKPYIIFNTMYIKRQDNDKIILYDMDKDKDILMIKNGNKFVNYIYKNNILYITVRSKKGERKLYEIK